MKKQKHVLFISLIFQPDKRVGALRISYWAKHIRKFGYKADVLTTTPKQCDLDSIDNYHFVPNDRSSFFGLFSSDQGFGWRKAIKIFLNEEKVDEFSVVLITGGPFGQFLLIPYLKKRFPGCMVALDYRDPFAGNPRASSSVLPELFRRCLNNYFISKSDIVITTNPEFLAIIDPWKKNVGKTLLIDNGYDESVIPARFTNRSDYSLSSGLNLRFIYAGSLPGDRNIVPFLESLSENTQMELHHIGAKIEQIKNYSNVCTEYGLLSYEDTLAKMIDCHIGLILVGKGNNESTTKVFDYMAMRLPILILTAGRLFSGEIHEVTKNYPNVFWSYNSYSEIKKILKIITSKDLTHDVDQDSIQKYSRSAGLRMLVQHFDARFHDTEE